MRQYIGYAMLAAPFIGVFAFAAHEAGIGEALILFGGIVFLMVWLRVAMELAI